LWVYAKVHARIQARALAKTLDASTQSLLSIEHSKKESQELK
jgi:DNA-binding XRE family transcriptional regulator